MMNSELAIYGGSSTVTEKYRERWRKIRWRDASRILRCALHDEVTSISAAGPIGILERGFTELTGTKYALAMNSGTATLHSAYFAVGVKPGDEVIVPTYTFFASAAPILQCGGIPVFCDIDEHTLTADPDDVERRITPRTRAICVVHVWGNPARLDRFVDIARRHDLALIEDCSHAHGAEYQGKAVGSWGDIGCFSLQGSKPVSGGELGIAVTNNPKLYDHMLALGHFGRLVGDQKANSFQLDNLSLGIKYRPHLYAVLLATGSLRRLHRLNELRRRNYEILASGLDGCRAVRPIGTYPDAVRGGLLEYILRFEPEHAGGWNRGAFVKAAQAEGVPVEIDRYTTVGKVGHLLHQTELFQSLDYGQFGGYLGGGRCASHTATKAASLPVATRLADQLLTLPPFTKVSEGFIRQCAHALRKVAAFASSENPASGSAAHLCSVHGREEHREPVVDY